MMPQGTLERRDGSTCPPVPFQARLLTEADLGAVLALHDTVRATMRPDLFAEEADGFFDGHVHRKGCILGLLAEDRLIAYGVLGIPGPGDPNFGDLLDLTPEERRRVAHIDGAAILPLWRGNGLHRLLIGWRLDEALRRERTIALTTAAPENLPSVRNLLTEGMTVRALRQKFGGWRYFLRRDLDGPPPVPPDDVRWVDVTDTETQLDLLRQGHIGWRAEGHKVSYGLP